MLLKGINDYVAVLVVFLDHLAEFDQFGNRNTNVIDVEFETLQVFVLMQTID